jgi:hypothetical protein
MTAINLAYYHLQDLVVYLTVFAALGTLALLLGLLLYVLRDE